MGFSPHGLERFSMQLLQRLTNVAVDAVFDSESIGTTFQKELEEAPRAISTLSWVRCTE